MAALERVVRPVSPEPPAEPVAVRVGVGQPGRRRAARADVHEGRGQVGPLAPHRRGRRREAGRLEGRLAVEVVHGPVPAERAHLLGQGALLRLVEVGGHPGVEDDERVVAGDGGGDPGQVRHHVAALEPRGVRRGAHVGQRGAQAAEAHRVVRPLAGQQPPGRVVGARVERREVEADPVGHGRQAQLGQVREVVPGGALEGHGGTHGAGGQAGAAVGHVGVGVVVEEQVEAGRGAEVEQRQRDLPAVERRDVAEAGEQRRAAPDLVGLGGAGGDQLLELGAVGPAEVGEGGDDVGATGGGGRSAADGGTVS